MKEDGVRSLSLLETCNTVSFSPVWHLPASLTVSLSVTGARGRQIRCPMACASLVSSPPAPVLDKNMTDSELAGDERSSNLLVQLFNYAHLCVSVLWLYVLVLPVFFSYSATAGFRDMFSPTRKTKPSSLHASLVQFKRSGPKHPWLLPPLSPPSPCRQSCSSADLIFCVVCVIVGVIVAICRKLCKCAKMMEAPRPSSHCHPPSPIP